jgi:Ca-activated chloride channel family protein
MGRLRPVVLGLVLMLVLSGCGSLGPQGPTIQILSASENETLQPMLDQFAQRERLKLEFTYRGSVDIMLALEGGETRYDAVWPASSLWLTLGDSARRLKHEKSIMRSPVVVGVKQSVARRLGWVGAPVRVADLLRAIEDGQLRFMMTSASQSNSGASAYLGFLYAFAGSPEVLTAEHLRQPAVRDGVKRILGGVNRSSGSSGWLKDLFLERPDDFDAMINYESVVIETNQALLKIGREPLYAIYPVDGLSIADSPLAYVNQGDAQKEEAFLKLQGYLLSPTTQEELLRQGRRVGLVGLKPDKIDTAVFNPAWGIDLDRLITPIRFPQAEVLREALRLYQTAFRKPSLTVFCLDFSGSMGGEPERDLKEAMRTLLDQQTAGRYLLEATPDDVTIIIPFNNRVITEWTVAGNNPSELAALRARIDGLSSGGGTNIYDPVIRGFELIKGRGLGDRLPSVILMTDGKSNDGSFTQLRGRWQQLQLRDVPVHAILFGDASREQLTEITTLTAGRIFDGRQSLVQAFRTAKGYN